MQFALNQLGFKTYHMKEVFGQGHIDLWIDVAHGKPNWDKIFEKYDATVDWPACNYYKELYALNPNAKVILNIRDPKSWIKSVQETVYAFEALRRDSWFFRFSLRFNPFLSRTSQMLNEVIWDKQFNGVDLRTPEGEKLAIQIFMDHIAAVKAAIPSYNLLMYDVKEGWEPLCTFLNVPVPEDKPFPRVNDTEEFKRRTKIVKVIVYAPVVLLGTAIVAGLSYLAWTQYKH